MAQTPARDFIKTAVVDFRFCNGDARNHANTAWTLVNTGVPVAATIQPAHGVPALIGVDVAPEQTWMTAAQTDITVEALLSLDMLHLGAATVNETASAMIVQGSWNIGFGIKPEVGQATSVELWASFDGEALSGGNSVFVQTLSAAQVTSLFKGSLVHVVIGASYVAGVSMTVTTCVNGVTTTATTANVGFGMTAAPTNTLFDTTVPCPVYLLRMWNAYASDALVLADLYREARTIVPGIATTAPSGAITARAPA